MSIERVPDDEVVPTHHNPLGLPPTFAGQFLDHARTLQENRAATYEQPGGERSMEKTVKAFNAITGHALTESEGWLFMVALKLVRGESGKAPHRDSAEDLVSYSSLYAEARVGGR
jgi:Domain of unknown function (DUF6378)